MSTDAWFAAVDNSPIVFVVFGARLWHEARKVGAQLFQRAEQDVRCVRAGLFVPSKGDMQVTHVGFDIVRTQKATLIDLLSLGEANALGMA